jgi:oxygen-independent coproporphyrinogen-3 oxidase
MTPMSLVIDKQTLSKYDVPGPRYTSYPTAPEWDKGFTAKNYIEKLKLFGQNDKTLSLYIHVPFCESLCYFCACNKVIRANEEKVGEEFLSHLFKEMDLVATYIGKRKLIRQLHWGGGTPSYLSEVQIQKLFNKIHSLFDIDFNEEIAIEVDPRTVPLSKLKVLRELGFNRISLGVQDFDEKVQDDINRIQPFEQVKQITQWCRDLKFASINFDLIYGLPYQTKATFQKTLDLVVGLNPDRIALYSFAYVPWISKPQNKFNLEAIPVNDEKLDIFINSRNTLLANGYQAIAMDHFALKSDEMAKAFNEGRLYRNFMGYTVKPADEFIGMGPSAIGFLENTFAQNVKVLPDYYEITAKNQLPIERGKVLSQDDIIRQWIIRSLMCQFEIDTQAFQKRFGHKFEDYFSHEQEHLRQSVEDGLIVQNGNRISVTELGRIFIRNVCMGFDWYLKQKDSHKRFSRTV